VQKLLIKMLVKLTPGKQCQPVTNTLAYWAMALIKNCKSFFWIGPQIERPKKRRRNSGANAIKLLRL
jgi:hypothetical protein